MPRKQLSSRPVPSWLKNLNASSKFDRNVVLANSIYYPGSNIDGGPLQAYGGFAHSFVYVDYYCDKEAILTNLPCIGGYEPVFIKEISRQELVPNASNEIQFENSDFFRSQPYQSIAELKRNAKSHFNPRVNPFCIWSVFQRKARTSPSHGPERFSILSIFGEGVATYDSIYNSNCVCPIAIIIKGADIGFGRNWTLFEQRGGVFERVVMSNTVGIPKYLFTWDRYDPTGRKGNEMYSDIDMYWEKYTTEVSSRNYLSIWTTDCISHHKE